MRRGVLAWILSSIGFMLLGGAQVVFSMVLFALGWIYFTTSAILYRKPWGVSL